MGEAAILWKRAEAASARGHWEMADADYGASAALYEKQGARPTLARVLRGWGETLRLAGRGADGDDKLRQALTLFEEMGLARESAEVRASLTS